MRIVIVAPVLLSLTAAATAAGTVSSDILVMNKLEFSRIGYHGTMWFNRDGTYVLVQIDPKSNATVFSGRWTPNGRSGFCMVSATSATPKKCFQETPGQVDRPQTITSSLGEVYRVVLRLGR